MSVTPITPLAALSPPLALDTPRLLLRRDAPQDPDRCDGFALLEQERERLGRFLPNYLKIQTLQDFEAEQARHLKMWEENSAYTYVMRCRHTGQYLGQVGLYYLAWEHRRVELGYWVGAQAEGKGLVTEAAKCLLHWAQSQGFHRIEVRCAGDNPRSAAVPLRLGFTHEATLRDECVLQGAYTDTLIFSLLLPSP